jgi:hypothetical protein
MISTTETVHGGREMVPLYDLKDSQSFTPQAFRCRSRNISLFPVPQDNSVGTNDIGNAVTIISFPKDKLDYETYFRNAVDDIGGGGKYLPVISPDLIGFGQTRSFFLFDFKKKIHHEFRIEMSIEKYILKISIADARQRLFIFEIKEFDPRSNSNKDYTKTLQLIDLRGEKPRVIKKMQMPQGEIWATINDKVFLYNRKIKQLQVLDMKLEPSHHPIEDAIERNKDKLDFSRIQLHPYLPFAILFDGKNAETVINWGERRDNSPQALLTNATQFFFSPDGKWVVLQSGSIIESTKTFLMPVSEKYPHYLGSPILLSNGDISGNKAAWTTNPTAFVGSSLDEILRWDLTNQPHPNSDRMSFHDYIVERDLEKLGKEKRQGLGETR